MQSMGEHRTGHGVGCASWRATLESLGVRAGMVQKPRWAKSEAEMEWLRWAKLEWLRWAKMEWLRWAKLEWLRWAKIECSSRGMNKKSTVQEGSFQKGGEMEQSLCSLSRPMPTELCLSQDGRLEATVRSRDRLQPRGENRGVADEERLYFRPACKEEGGTVAQVKICSS